MFDLRNIPGIDSYKIMFDGYTGRRRESYLVSVIDEKGKKRLYWPRVKHLEKVEE